MDNKPFAVPCVGDVLPDCSCCPDDSGISYSGNSSNSASETDITISIFWYHKSLKLYYLFEIPDEPPCYKHWVRSYGLVI